MKKDIRLKKGFDFYLDEKYNVCQIRNGKDLALINLTNKEEKDIFEKLLTRYKYKSTDSLEELCGKYSKDKVYSIVSKLNDYGLFEDQELYKTFDKDLDLQLRFWSLKSCMPHSISAQETQKRIKNSKLLLLGNGVSLDLLESKSKLSGFENITKITLSSKLDETTLTKNIENSDFIIFDNNEHNPYFLEFLNQVAFRNDKPWILFNGVDSLKASIGPLFKGKETGCYKCFMSRLKSNMAFLPYFEEFEKYLISRKKTAASQGAPMVLYDMAASICVLEAEKYLTDWAIPMLYKNYLTINVLGLETKLHPFLKSPVCEVCTPQSDFNPAPWLEPITLNQ